MGEIYLIRGKKIDLEHWPRREHFQGFIQMAAPCYGMNVRMDVTELVNLCKKEKESFFVNMLYLCLREMNQVEEFRMRVIDREPWIYDTIHCSFTVLNHLGCFVNRRADFCEYPSFYQNVCHIVSKAKGEANMESGDADCARMDLFYFSCIPWIDFQSITQPLITQPATFPDPAGDSVPRVSWGKYVEEDGRYRMTMHMTVNHALIDGRPLAEAFNRIQSALNHLEF